VRRLPATPLHGEAGRAVPAWRPVTIRGTPVTVRPPLIVIGGDCRPRRRAQGTSNDGATAPTDFVANEGTEPPAHGSAERRIDTLAAGKRRRRSRQASNQYQ
jgi:hypothetical protein